MSNSPSNKHIVKCSLVSLSLFLASPASAELFINGELSYNTDDNVSRAELDAEIFSDNRIDAAISIGKFSDHDNGLSTTISGGFEYSDYKDWSGLSHGDIVASLNVQKKIGLGAFVPSMGAQLTLRNQQYDAEVRDNNQWDLNLYWKKRLTEQWDIKIDIGLFEMSMDQALASGPSGVDTPGPGPGPNMGMQLPGDTFDQDASYFGLEAGYAFGDLHLFIFNVNFRSGDVVSTATPNDPIVRAASAISPDAAFGDGFFAYRIDADTQTISLGWNMIISDDSSFTVSYENQDTEGDGSIDYKSDIVSIQFLTAF